MVSNKCSAQFCECLREVKAAGRHTFARITVLALGCAACSPNGVAAPTGIRTALREYEANHCNVEAVVEREGLYGTTSLITLRHWLYDSLLRSKRVQIAWERHNNFRDTGEVSYRQGPVTFHVWWNDYHPPGIPVRRQIDLRTCLFEPKAIHLVDSLMDRKTGVAEVRFITFRRLSWIGGQLQQMNLLRGNNAFEPMNGYSETAVLKGDTLGLWRVEYISG